MIKHFKSVFDNEQELLKALIAIHLNGKDIELDPMYFKGNFYKKGINQPKYRYDINPQVKGVEKQDAEFLYSPINFETIGSVILDPPFMIANHGKQKSFYSSRTHTFYDSFDGEGRALYQSYFNIIKDACRYLKPNGVMIFKCQDFTDSKTIFTHCVVKNIAERWGFYPKDLAILVKPNKVTNPSLKQRHLRKIHTYFWVFIKKGNFDKLNY